MNIEVINNHNDLERDVYNFYFSIDISRHMLRLDRFTKQSRQTKRHKWVSNETWDWHFKQNSNVDKPKLSEYIKLLLRSKIESVIKDLMENIDAES